MSEGSLDFDGDGQLSMVSATTDVGPDMWTRQYARDSRGRETQRTYAEQPLGHAYPPQIYHRTAQIWGEDPIHPLERQQTVASDLGERSRPVSRVLVNDVEDGWLVGRHGFELVDDVSGHTLEWTIGVDNELLGTGGRSETHWTESGSPRAWAVAAAEFEFHAPGAIVYSMRENATGGRRTQEYTLTGDGCRQTTEIESFTPSDPIHAWETGIATDSETSFSYKDLLLQSEDYSTYNDGIENHRSRTLYEWSCPPVEQE